MTLTVDVTLNNRAMTTINRSIILFNLSLVNLLMLLVSKLLCETMDYLDDSQLSDSLYASNFMLRILFNLSTSLHSGLSQKYDIE